MKTVVAYVVTTQIRRAVFDVENDTDMGGINMTDMTDSEPVGKPGYIGRIFEDLEDAEDYEGLVIEGRQRQG